MDDKASKLFELSINKFPEYADAYSNMGVILEKKGRLNEALKFIKKAVEIKSDYAGAHNNLALILLKLEDYSGAEKSFEKVLELSPDDPLVLNNLGQAIEKLGRYKDAEVIFKKSIKIKPYAFTLSNLANLLNFLDRAEEAEIYLRMAIKENPNEYAYYINLGAIIANLGKLGEAESLLKKAVSLNPDIAEAYNNLGTVSFKLGKLERSIEYFSLALKIKPKNNISINGLLESLDRYNPDKMYDNRLIYINNQYRKIILKNLFKEKITDDAVSNLYLAGEKIYKSNNIDFLSDSTQIFKRNGINLNCDRHMFVFNKHNIIPKNCFGCYKVQVDPKNVLELLKLYLLFDSINLKNNNIRKCIVEIRNNVSGFYKGLIYCESLNEAKNISTELNILLRKSIRHDLTSKIKRGCSEYPLAFPEYEKISETKIQPMNYIKSWEGLENSIDEINNDWGLSPKSLPFFTLNNFLTIRNWLAYAQAIGDPTVSMITTENIRTNIVNIEDVINNQAALSQKKGDIKNAIKLYKKAIFLYPKRALSYSNLATIYRQLGRLKKAISLVEKAIQLDPGYADAYSNLGILLSDLGDFKRSEILFKKSISRDPNHLQSYYNLAQLLINNGDFLQSKKILLQALNINSAYSRFFYLLSTFKILEDNEPWIINLFDDKLLLNQNHYDLVDLYFARSNILHSLSQYDLSSKYLNSANELKLSLYPSELKQLLSKSKRLKILSKFLPKQKQIISNNFSSIFIVGLPRSGSTLLESIISINKNVIDLGEKNILEESYEEWVHSLENNSNITLDEIYTNKIFSNNKPSITTNKWLYNYQYAGFIASQIPNSKIIHCFRNPLDNILSIYRTHFATGNNYSSSLIDCANLYIDQAEIMTHYKHRFKSKIYGLNYDLLVTKPKSTIQALISWLGWEWDDSYLSPELNPRSVSTASNVQVRSPINARSVGGWKNYNDMLQPAIQVLNKTVNYENL